MPSGELCTINKKAAGIFPAAFAFRGLQENAAVRGAILSDPLDGVVGSFALFFILCYSQQTSEQLLPSASSDFFQYLLVEDECDTDPICCHSP